MNIKNILQNNTTPVVYSPGSATMWTDPHISQQLLEVHLNEHIELASRNSKNIKSTISWMLEQVPNTTLDILDLGCGPGLYCEKLARFDHRVTGVDFSRNSIDHAKQSATNKKLAISYLNQDYLALDEVESFNLIIMIFTDFGVLNPNERSALLDKVYKALKPGGKFIFDVLNEKSSVKRTGDKNWEIAEKGFWKESPYIALSESIHYETEDVTLNQHLIINEDGNHESYRFWVHTFTHNQLEVLVNNHGFKLINCHDKIITGSELCSEDAVTFCVAVK